MTKDLTTGKPLKLIFFFSIPLLIGNIFQQFYNMADTAIVGQTIGVEALAAVGATGAISFLIIGFIQGITGGFAVVTSQYFGAGKTDGVRRSVACSILLCAFATVVLTVISVTTARPLLELMKTPDNIIGDSVNYIVVIYWGTIAVIFYNMFSNVLRSVGDSRTPLIFLIIASLLNIGLDFLFILCFHMGVGGAGLATIISQAVSAVLCFLYARIKYPDIMPKREDWKSSLKLSWQHLRVGLPMAFQFSVIAIGVMAVQTVLNRFGSDTIAAFTAASKIDQLCTQALVSFGMAMATFVGQNYGANRMDRIRSGVKSCALISLVFSIVGATIILIFGRYISLLFIKSDAPQVVELAKTYLNYVAVFYPVLGLLFVFRNSLQGMGNSGIPMLSGVTEVVMRVLAAFLLANAMGYAGVCLAGPIAWVGADLVMIPAYFLIMRKQKRKEMALGEAQCKKQS